MWRREAGPASILWARLRRDRARAGALVAGIAAAATAFSMLTAGAEVERLEVRGTVDADAAGGYHILVRPEGSRSELETTEGLIRANHLSGQFGGLTVDDYEAIRTLPNAAVAAPVAMLGYVMTSTLVSVDTATLTDGAQRELLVADVTHVADRGLTRIEQPAASYAYLTSRPTTRLEDPTGSGRQGLAEIGDGGTPVVVCPVLARADGVPAADPDTATRERSRTCGSTAAGSDLLTATGTTAGAGELLVEWAFPLLVAAVDPAQEALLHDSARSGSAGSGSAGSGSAGSGSVLSTLDDPASLDPGEVPIVLAGAPAADGWLEVTVRRPPQVTVDAFASGRTVTEIDDLVTRSGGDRVATTTVTAAEAYGSLLTELADGPDGGILVDGYWSAGATEYDVTQDDRQLPRPVGQGDDLWASPLRATGYVPTPATVADTGFRPLHPNLVAPYGAGGGAPRLVPVGVFDPGEPDGSDLEGADAYGGGLVGADARSRDLLGDLPLPASGAPAGYQLGPPSALMRLADLAVLDAAGIGPQAPVSAVRVVVDGVTGVDEVSRERVRMVADAIQARVDADVDVVLGGSPVDRTIVMPAGRFGRPELQLTETWIRQGVASTVLAALDQKSVALFVLILVVCGLFVANATAAWVRSRRGELGLLSRLGWTRAQILRQLLAEVGLLAAAAAALALVASLGLGRVTGWDMTPGRALLAAAAAAAVTGAAATGAAWRGSATSPIPIAGPGLGNVSGTGDVALPDAGTASDGGATSAAGPGRAPVTSGAPRGRQRAPVRVRGTVSLTVAGILRRPGRVLAAASAVALGTAATTALLGIGLVFHGSVVGSVLGTVVSVRAREVDLVAGAVMVVLAAVAVADAVFLGSRERPSELALLLAVGWDARRVAATILAEAALVGTVGAVLGAAGGLTGVVVVTGELPALLPLVAACCTIGSVAVAVVASLAVLMAVPTSAPARRLSRDA